MRLGIQKSGRELGQLDPRRRTWEYFEDFEGQKEGDAKGALKERARGDLDDRLVWLQEVAVERKGQRISKERLAREGRECMPI